MEAIRAYNFKMMNEQGRLYEEDSRNRAIRNSPDFLNLVNFLCEESSAEVENSREQIQNFTLAAYIGAIVFAFTFAILRK